MFEKQKLENKDKVSELRQQFAINKIGVDDIPNDILVELFKIAIYKLDELENGGEYDERDWKDQLCDKKFIINGIFAELEEDIKIGIYE